MPSWRFRSRLNRCLAAGLICVLGAASGPAAASPNDPPAQPASESGTSEVIRISKPDGTVVVLRVPRGSLRPVPRALRPVVVRVSSTRATGASPARTFPRHAGGTAAPTRSTSGTASSAGPAPRTGRGTSAPVRISHPDAATRTLNSRQAPGGAARRRGGSTADAAPPAVAGDEATEWRTGRAWAPWNEGDDRGDYLSGATEFAMLEAGPGWAGPTENPAPVGDESMPGYDAGAIARWDAVPFQTIDEVFHIGVVAFHMNGIDRVEFAVNGGPWSAVRDMQLNPRTNVWEYTVLLDPAALAADGLIEVRAVAYPRGAGVPRLLAGEFDADAVASGEHSLFAWANAGGSLPEAEVWCSPAGSDTTGDGSRENPFRSPYKALQSVGNSQGNAGGSVCYLEEGSYSWGPYVYPRFDTEDRWATITAAPGAARENVIFDAVGSGGMRTHFIRVANCTITTALTSASSPAPSIWLDNCDIIGPGRYGDFQILFAQNWLSTYYTDCSIADTTNAYDGATLARNVSAERLGSDAFSRSRMIVNATVNDIDAGNSSYHPDLFQISGSSDMVWDNILLYNVFGTNINAQGLFADDVAEVNNIAIVNVCAQVTAPVMKSQWKDVSTNHLLLWNTTLVDQPFVWRAGDTRNISVRGGVWQKMEGTISDEGFESNHFIEPDTYAAITPGTDISTGDPMFNNPADFDFSPAPGSPLLARLAAPRVIADCLGAKRIAPCSLGAFGPSKGPQ